MSWTSKRILWLWFKLWIQYCYDLWVSVVLAGMITAQNGCSTTWLLEQWGHKYGPLRALTLVVIVDRWRCFPPVPFWYLESWEGRIRHAPQGWCIRLLDACWGSRSMIRLYRNFDLRVLTVVRSDLPTPQGSPAEDGMGRSGDGSRGD